MDKDILFMQRALDLALLGQGNTSPNPLVGCVIVYQDKIIGEGWHKQYGGPHAEVNAINDVKDHSILKQCTVYVTLEPCAHFGKTPPCADLLVEKQVKKVVIANTDPNPLVAGKGIDKLKSAGIEVTTGVLEEEGWHINRRFFTYLEKKRPFIILKWAETADGFIAKENYDSKWISNPHSRKIVHKMRAEEDAIMVGTNTAKYDNPKLNVREWKGNDPIRVVIDKRMSLPAHLHLFDQQQPTICYNLLKNEEQENLTYVQIDEAYFLEGILKDLFKRKIQSLVVEGGTFLLHTMIASENWDEAWVFKAPTTFDKGIEAPKITEKLTGITSIVGDQLFKYTKN